MRVIIAEDESTSRTLLAAVVKKWGFEPVAVADGVSALRELSGEDAPPLAILDWNMPGASGLEICKKVREMAEENPPYIIILSSRSEKACIVEGLEAGANDYVIKPFDAAELWSRVRVGKRMIEMQSAMNDAKRALAHEATHDPLTGILNRRAILESLQKEISRARRQNTTLSIGLCDIDHFKQVNDRYGHQSGDDVLCGFVRAVQDSLRNYDLMGRYGGEEFLVIAPGAVDAGKNGLFERLRARIAGQVIETRSGAISVTVSIGVVESDGAESMDDLLAAADSALYFAKANGRNRVAYNSEVGKKAS